MAEQTSSSIVIDAPAADVMAVIADFPEYPKWAKGVTTAEVRASFDAAEPGAAGRAREVFFALDVSPIKDEYTLSYDWDGDRQVTWTLVQGKMLRALDGAYVLRERGTGAAVSTEVTYRLALDVSIPLIGMLKRKGEKILIDTALKGLKKRVEAQRSDSPSGA
ncbi:MAG TPA: SRPBCC family protein [Nocardioides sp.]|nr:SRPBCC family protein [Nocardioides sp.]